MNYYLFVFFYGLLFSFMVLLVVWLLRSSSTALAWKLVALIFGVGLSITTPYTIGALMGFPTPTQTRLLPQRLQLLAVWSEDPADNKVDVWVRDLQEVAPRVYQIAPDSDMKKELGAAKRRLANGEAVYMTQGEEGKEGEEGAGDDKTAGNGKAHNTVVGSSNAGKFHLVNPHPLPPK